MPGGPDGPGHLQPGRANYSRAGPGAWGRRGGSPAASGCVRAGAGDPLGHVGPSGRPASGRRDGGAAVSAIGAGRWQPPASSRSFFLIAHKERARERASEREREIFPCVIAIAHKERASERAREREGDLSLCDCPSENAMGVAPTARWSRRPEEQGGGGGSQ